MLNIHRTRFAPRQFRAADPGAPTGGPTPPAPQSLTLEQQLSKARDDLAASNSEVTRLKDFESRVTALTAERDSLKSQFDSLTTTANGYKTERDNLQSQVSTITSERDTARTDLATANSHKSRLEKLCSVQGVDPNGVPPAPPEPDSAVSDEEWSARFVAAKTPAAKAKVLNEMETATAARKTGKA